MEVLNNPEPIRDIEVKLTQSLCEFTHKLATNLEDGRWQAETHVTEDTVHRQQVVSFTRELSEEAMKHGEDPVTIAYRKGLSPDAPIEEFRISIPTGFAGNHEFWNIGYDENGKIIFLSNGERVIDNNRIPKRLLNTVIHLSEAEDTVPNRRYLTRRNYLQVGALASISLLLASCISVDDDKVSITIGGERETERQDGLVEWSDYNEVIPRKYRDLIQFTEQSSERVEEPFQEVPFSVLINPALFEEFLKDRVEAGELHAPGVEILRQYSKYDSNTTHCFAARYPQTQELVDEGPKAIVFNPIPIIVFDYNREFKEHSNQPDRVTLQNLAREVTKHISWVFYHEFNHYEIDCDVEHAFSNEEERLAMEARASQAANRYIERFGNILKVEFKNPDNPQEIYDFLENIEIIEPGSMLNTDQ